MRVSHQFESLPRFFLDSFRSAANTDRKLRTCVVGFYLATNLAGLAQCIQTTRRTDAGLYGFLNVRSSMAAWQVYDAAHHRLVSLNDTKSIDIYDGNHWTQLATAGTPPLTYDGGVEEGRQEFGVCYDSVGGEVLVFGGGAVYLSVGYSLATNDLYALRGNAWVQRHPGGTDAPWVGINAAGWIPGAFDPVRGRAIFLVRSN